MTRETVYSKFFE